MGILSGYKKFKRYVKTDTGYQPMSLWTSADTVFFKDGSILENRFINMKGATSTANGMQGLVPAPSTGSQAKFLRGDGTWQAPPNTTYTTATQSSNGLLSSSDKTKLDGIAAKANNYTHPSTHPANVIVQDGNNRFVSDSQINIWNSKVDASQITSFKKIVFSTTEPTTVPDDTIVFVYGNE